MFDDTYALTAAYAELIDREPDALLLLALEHGDGQADIRRAGGPTGPIIGTPAYVYAAILRTYQATGLSTQLLERAAINALEAGAIIDDGAAVGVIDDDVDSGAGRAVVTVYMAGEEESVVGDLPSDGALQDPAHDVWSYLTEGRALLGIIDRRA